MLFDEAATKRIEATIADIESRTAGEVVVVAVAASDRYDDVRLLSAAGFGLGITALAHLIWPLLAVTYLLWLEVAAAVIGYLIVSWPPLLRRMLPAWRAQAEVARRAHQEFFQHGVFETRDRTGVLILLSELEHRVVILGDKGIDEHVQADGWKAHVDRIVSALRAGKGADGVCQVIAAIGETLAKSLPPRSDDRDELENRVRQEGR